MPSPLELITLPARASIRRWVLGAFPRHGSGGLDYDHPAGDPGLFGPDSATWRVHSDFPGMLAGGLAALMLQTLHPRALAGVWDHSNFARTWSGACAAPRRSWAALPTRRARRPSSSSGA